MIQKSFTRFVIKCAILTIILLIIGYAIFNHPQFQHYYLPVFPWMLGLFAILNISLHRFIIQSAKKNTKKFNHAFMISFVVKLLIYMTLLIINLFTLKHNLIPFVIVFAILYMTYTSFEVSSIFMFLKKQKHEN